VDEGVSTDTTPTTAETPLEAVTLSIADILEALRRQESYLAEGGVWVYTVKSKEPNVLPESFDEKVFRQGVAGLMGGPSYKELGIVPDDPESQAELSVESYVVLDDDGENRITLLCPEQFYLLDAEGRECHEFVRYAVAYSGEVLNQQIVRRTFVPGEGAQEVIVTETPGGGSAAVVRLGDISYDILTTEGALTPWGFGLSFDYEALGPRPMSVGLSEWELSLVENGESYKSGPDGTALPAVTLKAEHWTAAPSVRCVGFLDIHEEQKSDNTILCPFGLAWHIIDSSPNDTLEVAVTSWLEADGLPQDAVIPRTAQRAGTLDQRDESLQEPRSYSYELTDFTQLSSAEPSMFDTPDDAAVQDERGLGVDGVLEPVVDSLAVDSGIGGFAPLGGPTRELISIDFTNEHKKLTDQEDTYEGTGSLYGPGEPDWEGDPCGDRFPVSYSKGTTVNLSVKVKVTDPDRTFKLVGNGPTIDGQDCLDFESGCKSTSSQEQTITVSAADSLPDKIRYIALAYIDWHIEWCDCPGGSANLVHSPSLHEIFVTWGTPMSEEDNAAEPTYKRMKFAVQACNGQSTLKDCAQQLSSAIDDATDFGSWLPLDLYPWKCMDAVPPGGDPEYYRCDCDRGRTIAYCCLWIMGVPTSLCDEPAGNDPFPGDGEARLENWPEAYPSTDTTQDPPYYYSNCTTQETKWFDEDDYPPCNPPRYVELRFQLGPGGGWSPMECLFRVYNQTDSQRYYTAVKPPTGPYRGYATNTFMHAMYRVMNHQWDIGDPYVQKWGGVYDAPTLPPH